VSDETATELRTAERAPAWVRMAGLLASDVAVGALLAALIMATLLFSTGVSKFVYIDF
jgi:hypothetical protein